MLDENNMLSKEDFIILLVDDEPEVVRDNISLLKMEGYKAIGAHSGSEGLDIIKNEKIDILLLDYFMPGMTGEEVVKELRKFNKEIVILLQTGYAGEKPPLEMLEQLDIQGYHDKNEGPDKLLLWVTACVRSCAQMRENKRMFEEVQLANKTIESIKKEQDKLIQQEKMAFLGKLVWGVTESLNIPVISMRGAVEELVDLTKEYKESIDDPNVTKEDYKQIVGEMDEYLEKLKSYNSKMADVIGAFRGQLLSFEEEQDQEISIDEITKRIQVLIQKDAKLNYCNINQNIQVDSSTKIKGGNKLVTVINNLLRNSIQSYNDGGNIEVMYVPDGENIKITVKDNGCGIPNEIQDKIFKEVVTTKGENGMGLGLYVSYAMVKGKLGGSMSFESEEGKGTEFHVVIPVVTI